MNAVQFEGGDEKAATTWWHDGSLVRHVVDKRVVTLGGGTGPFALLSQLKHLPCSVSAIVTMSDSGGSSRRLMDEFGQLPLGDLRQALVALSRRSTLWRDIFAFRFPDQHTRPSRPSMRMDISPAMGNGSTGVGGHSLGNLIISALQDLSGGSLLQALEDAEDLLGIAGKVLPVTLSRATLCAVLADGNTICGETEIDRRGHGHTDTLPPIQRIYLEERPVACDAALRAIRQADIIVLGPGDLYTSVLPNLLVDGMAEAIRSSSALKVYICNLMTKHGETDAFRASDFVREIHHYLGGSVDRVILHNGCLSEPKRAHYAAEGQYPVEPDVDVVRLMVSEVAVDDYLTLHSSGLIRHDAAKLLSAVFAPSLGARLALSTAQPVRQVERV